MGLAHLAGPFRLSRKIVPVFLVAFALVVSAAGGASANPKYAGLVIDAKTGKTLYADNADAYRYPASLTKMMTLYMVFEALSSGRISLGTRIPVSRKAAAEPPSKIGLRAGGTITVENAIKALVTKSANDVATAVGEFLGGSEDGFARLMTEKAHQLGMSRTTFKNAHGLPDSRQKTTARDMARLGLALREHHPKYYGYFSTRSFTYGGRRYGNHNRLLGRVKGVDGIKTGYIRASGFNLVTSVVDGNRSVVAVVMGGRSGASRNAHMTDLLRRYLPKASTGRDRLLVADKGGTPAFVAGMIPGNQVPLPTSRPQAPAPVVTAYAAETAATVPMPLVEPKRPPQPVDPVRTASTTAAPVTAAVQAEPEPQPAAGSRLPSGWVVQVASMPSDAEARAFLDATKDRVGTLLAQATGFTETFEKGGVTYHRARYGGFASKDAAWDTCNALKRKGISCYAVAR